MALKNAQSLEQQRAELQFEHEKEMEVFREESQKDYEMTALRLSSQIEAMEEEQRKNKRYFKNHLNEKEKEIEVLKVEIMKLKKHQFDNLVEEVSSVRAELAMEAAQKIDEALNDDGNRKSEDLRMEHEEQIQALMAQHEDQVKALSQEYEDQIRELREERDISEKWSKSNVDAPYSEFENKMKEIKDHYEREIERLGAENEELRTSSQISEPSERSSAEKHVEEMMEKHASEIEMLQAALERNGCILKGGGAVFLKGWSIPKRRGRGAP
ncbi:predicted protein [Nematostella vectensis]|uniref:Dynein regulatory complex subunit 4 n=1 Tax=Nematostella vectensis TaxID=45351 RepID=A8DWF1_NEMVE|nr:predicted protein [Nematostella vectensis]|eukprot:XP_001617558.1 hypothetical protein NEMVEDRAFT_v1g225985 [Nematostella vectensis]